MNMSWWQHFTRHQLYGHLPPITKTIQVRQTKHAGHCWRRRDELISDVLLWTPTYGRAKARRPAQTYIQQLCEDTGCSSEDLPSRWTIGRSGERASGIIWRWQYNDLERFSAKGVGKISVILFTNPSARAGYDTRSIFKRSLTGFNSDFSFS